MSAKAVMRTVLLQNSRVTDLVGTRIYPGVIPQTAALPAIAVMHIGSVDHESIGLNSGTTLVTSRIQVTVKTKSATEQEALIAAVTDAGKNRHGVVGDVLVDSIRRDIDGPDDPDDDAKIYAQSKDFIIKWQRPNT